MQGEREEVSKGKKGLKKEVRKKTYKKTKTKRKKRERNENSQRTGCKSPGPLKTNPETSWP